jgi:DNA-binding XRE family transcriptional regulator
MGEWNAFKDEVLSDPEARAAYDARKPAYELASKLIAMRKKLGLSQRDLARAAGLKQPHVARIERGDVSPTWATTSRIFAAVGAELEVIYKGERGKA